MTNEVSGLEQEIEATRERLAKTIDELVYRTSPKTIAERQVSSAKAFFTDPVTGDPRTDNIAKVAAGVAGLVVVFAVLRRLSR